MTAQPRSWLQDLGIAIEVFFPALALLVVALRVYSRLNTKTFGWDDACIVIAMALSIALAVGSIICMKLLYVGIHVWDIPLDADFETGMLWSYITGAVYNPILAIVKQSVLIFILRFGGIKRVVRIVVWVTAIFNAALMIAVFFAVLFQCNPIEGYWKPYLGARCINSTVFAVSTAIFTILTDLVAIALPFYIVLGLNLSRKKKIGLMAVFMLGIIVTVTGIVRLYFLYKSLWANTDPDFSFSLGFVVASIECNLAIITASAPALWPLVRHWAPEFSSTRDHYPRNNNISSSSSGQQGWKRIVPAVVYGTKSVGGSSYGLKDMNIRGDRVQGRTEIKSNGFTPRDSDEEMLTGIGIVRTVAVTRDDESRRGPSHKHLHEPGRVAHRPRLTSSVS
ncbi:uncharacterized protein BCR38DRAFT_473941 [Pseudomassariella vexata]|uniref:Rhodopsin domain-containing protein n=1 Tax=Pseudomassariella vexata TaxID=1141098 RepID=A0A1Y2E253_9PEZI|nr:uncharacterized protein BCR38DRAFT_473941 [Pseudomassariella vexata]ORY64945.1 hypothetical protein BCR38DRAFT_473941 [Pseudomassariella vexata]